MKILMPLPATDFDPTEAAVPWRALAEAGCEVVFATPDGAPASADPVILTGRGLGPLGPMLRARPEVLERYEAMVASPSYQAPVAYGALAGLEVDGAVLPGGHAPGMKVYLESPEVQARVGALWSQGRPVGAICHGVVVLARTTDPTTGRPALEGRQTTALLRSQEMSAWWATRLWMGDYFRTYPEAVQDEVARALGPTGRFHQGPTPIARDSSKSPEAGFVVRDGHYVSARWPGDAFTFSRAFLALLEA